METKSREAIKSLIERSHDVDEADKVINENYGFKSVGEKMAFLKGMFGVVIVSVDDEDGVSKEESDEITYMAMLNTIINY